MPVMNFLKQNKLLSSTIFLICYFFLFHKVTQSGLDEEELKLMRAKLKNYLVYGSNCKIRRMKPFDPEIMKYFKKQNYYECAAVRPLTKILYDYITKLYTLHINENDVPSNISKLDCCYETIERIEQNPNPDDTVKFTKCIKFTETVEIANNIDNILVKCNDNKKEIYINAHSFMQDRDDIRKRLDKWKKKDTKKPISILLIGINGISRTNLIRAMPKTYRKLREYNWFDMKGYTTVGDNNFSNLMAFLTGYNKTAVIKKCDLKKQKDLDKCPIIWKLFREHGYVTAYAEDEISLSTFNYFKPGFSAPPVDHYLRPFLIGADKYLKKYMQNGYIYCLGHQHSADHILSYATTLASHYKDDPFFGLFWVNTFSHSDISDCSAMDIKMSTYLEELSSVGILNETVVIFFSNHGLRIGPVAVTVSGYYEERLPFMYIWLPQWLKTEYPAFVDALNENKNQLTTPYDIYMTLKNLLELSGRISKDLPIPTSSPNCQSLLTPVPSNRSCPETGLEDHWCPCVLFESTDAESDLVKEIALFIVDYINSYIKKFDVLCEKFELHSIVEAYLTTITNDKLESVEIYRIILKTEPYCDLFEATVRRKPDTGKLETTESISRLNPYESDSDCAFGENSKKFCHCIQKASKDIKKPKV